MLHHLRGFLATKLLPTTRCSVKFRAQLAMLSCARLWYKVICSSAIVEFHHTREHLPRKKRVLLDIVQITSPPPHPTLIRAYWFFPRAEPSNGAYDNDGGDKSHA